MNKEEFVSKLICPYCNQEFTGEMKQAFDFTGSGCETCGYDEYTGSIEIHCEHCNKLVYKKEGIVIS